MQRKIELGEKWVKYLSKQPEQGMGYHRVKIVLRSGDVLEDRVVLNSMYLVLKEGENIIEDEIESIQVKSN